MSTANKFEIFGNYLLLKKIAEGGMAEVFLARPATMEGNGRLQVLKRILPHIANHSEFLGMFQREIQIIMGFNHANVVQLHDFGNIEGRPYIVMEYIDGRNLRDILDKLKSKNLKVPVPMALSLTAQAASGLHYAHTYVNKVSGEELNIIHRDVSPHNLLVSFEGNLKVIDFGIAKAACNAPELTRTGTVKGKAAYFSPEQITGQKVDVRTDIFSLGAVAWELLTGERLFAKAGDSEVTAMSRVSNCEKHVIPPSTVNKEIPPEVDNVILMALEKNPKERYAHARQFQSALRQALIRHYPAYTYAETGRLATAIFADEIAKDQEQMRELNSLAQSVLVGDLDGKTVTISSGATPNQTVVTAIHRLEKSTEAIVDFRLSKIESMLKQKATTRHYVMLALYVISLFGLKLMENYDFSFDFSAAKASDVEVLPPQVAKAQPAVAMQPQQQHPQAWTHKQAVQQKPAVRQATPAAAPVAARTNPAAYVPRQPVHQQKTPAPSHTVRKAASHRKYVANTKPQATKKRTVTKRRPASRNAPVRTPNSQKNKNNKKRAR